MSVCFESGNSVLPGQAPKLAESSEAPDTETSRPVVKPCQENVAAAAAPLLQKVVGSPPMITVVNTPITVVKTIGGGGGCGSTSHFTLVNSAGVKSPPTITVVGAPPITVVKALSEQTVKSDVVVQPANNNGNLASGVAEKPSSMHNVFVKKSAPVSENANVAMPDIPQSHKLLTANSFPTSNVLSNLGTSPILKTANGQRSINAGSKVKILSNVVMPGNSPNAGPGPSNVLLNKNQRYYQQKVIGNGATKYLNRPPEKRVFYPIHKSQLKTLSGYKPVTATGTVVKTTGHPGAAVQRTGTGLRTIPPQRPPMPNKPNYIGKHAVQAQKAKPKIRTAKAAAASPINSHHHRPAPQQPPPAEQSAQMIFNQALTAQILETLSDKEGPNKSVAAANSYAACKYEPKHHDVAPKSEQRHSMSTLDTLSFVCQAVLLDHNYNATMPSEPTPSPVVSTPPMNGSVQFSPVSNYQTGITSVKRNRTSSQTIIQRDDDVASDISEERKADTEGEETDTAPEAEAVSNEANDRYGDYVTRCICGFIHDDGYMIECDKCKVWQHVRCVVRTKKVPEDYLCEECDPTKHTDRQKARALQQQWMREIQERDAKYRKEQLALSETDSSDGEAGKNRRKEPPRRQRRDSVQNRSSNKPNKRKDRKMPAKRSSKGKQTHDDEKIPQLRQWIENYEEAVTNHYSPELRARISSVRINGAHSELSGTVDPSVNKCKVQTVPPGVKCLVASTSLPLGTPVVELRGKYMLSTQHRATTRQQRPGPFLFFHTVIKDTEVCVDTRTYGNCARFVRRSCTPNAELQHVLEKGAVHLYIVTTKSIDKGTELTIRHESHDIAAAHTTEVPCACTNPEYCALIKGHRRHNGDSTVESRKRRGRQNRDVVMSPPQTADVDREEVTVKKEEIEEEVVIKQEIKEEPVVEVKEEVKEEIKVEVKTEVLDNEVVKEEPEDVKEEEEVKLEEAKVEEEQQVETVMTRRASRHSQEQSVESSSGEAQCPEKVRQTQKLSREERKLQAIMKAIERMEKQEQRRQEHQAKQAHRRESEPSMNNSNGDSSKLKRRKRKGRARTTSTNSRRNRLDSADSLHSSDDTLLSPPSDTSSPTKAAGLLLALANGESSRKSPDRAVDSNSNSAHSSPETPLSSACLLVAAAVEPLEPGFKFPKTKKVLMNEWLNKSDVVQSASAISPSSLTPHIDANLYATTGKNLSALAQAASYCDQPRSGSAKKRWLRQAISEDHCDSTVETAAPPKKRRLPRESLSADTSPPTTPTGPAPLQIPETDTGTVRQPEYHAENAQPPIETLRGIMDPRLTSRFASSDHLVGAVEKSLSFLGFEESKKAETPAKRKLSITEYRQRKKLNNNEKTAVGDEMTCADESNSSQSPKASRTRSDSSSSVTSGSTSDDDVGGGGHSMVPEVKALSAFNSEPTELERQRESVSLRLKRALGLSVADDEYKKPPPTLNVETILKGEIPLPSATKCTLPLSSPNFPIPGSAADAATPLVHDITAPPNESVLAVHSSSAGVPPKVDERRGDPVTYYTPDDEDVAENASYVPPFNNPVYPNNSYATYGSVIDDDAPYEGRNPSPPPEIRSSSSNNP